MSENIINNELIINKYPISVIVPCYNGESTILQALKSLENQSYKNFEVILINDGSKDRSDTIIRDFMMKSKLNINYIVQENAGVSKARNKGLDSAIGKYIFFLDSDDVLHNNYIEILYKLITQQDIDTAYCCYSRHIENIIDVNCTNEIKHNHYLDHQHLMNNFMYRKGPCSFQTFIYKKSIIDEYNITYVDNSRYGEDLEFTWKYLSHCRNGVYTNLKLYGYYNNPKSAVNSISWNITEALSSVLRVEEYFKNNHDEYLMVFKKYMYDRTIWAIMKDFAQAGDENLFLKMKVNYDVKKSMINMVVRASNFIVKITALVYCIEPKLFYWILRKLDFIKRR